MIIAIDFDGTIFKTDYPTIKEVMPDARRVIRKLFDAGHIIIIWTCREMEEKDRAICALRTHKIPYHYINENIPGKSIIYGNDCRKIGADCFIDDRNLGGFPGWKCVESYFFKRE